VRLPPACVVMRPGAEERPLVNTQQAQKTEVCAVVNSRV
jgi:hypothetical protein